MEYTRERAMEWLNKHWNTPKSCPTCKNNNWTVSESLALLPRRGELIEREDGERIIKQMWYPHFLVRSCFKTLTEVSGRT
jgi:hypothetical protein